MKDYTLIGLAFNDEIRIYSSISTNLVNKARKTHKLEPTSAAAMGRFLTASAMMSLMYKDGERLQLKIVGDGPIGQMLVDAKKGIVKSTIDNPNVYIKYTDGPKKGKLNVGAAVGDGFLYVTKDFNGHYFQSSSPLQTGEIADDFTYYYAISEQTPSAVGLGVLVSKRKSIIASGGFIIQVLPFASDSTISKIEEIVGKIPSVTDLIVQGNTPESIMNILSDNTVRILEQHEIKYKCDCKKSKFKNSIMSLDKNTLIDILHEDNQIEIICPYCKKQYIFNPTELEKIISKK